MTDKQHWSYSLCLGGGKIQNVVFVGDTDWLKRRRSQATATSEQSSCSRAIPPETEGVSRRLQSSKQQ